MAVHAAVQLGRGLLLLLSFSVTSARAVDVAASGSWYDPARSGEGLVVEVDAQGVGVVAWFTYDGLGAQRWFFGQGQLIGTRLHIADLLWPVGGRFGAAFDPTAIERRRVGSLTLDFESCSRLVAGYEVDGASGVLDLQRLTRPTEVDCSQSGAFVANASLARSGSWFDVRRSGEGQLVEVLADGRLLVYWFGYDLDGQQMWLIGTGQSNGRHWHIDELLRARGGRFGPDFDPAAVVLEHWGSARIALDCAAGMWHYEGLDERFGSGAHVLSRLHHVGGVECALPPPQRIEREQAVAFTAASVIDVDSGEIWPNQTVRVTNGTIDLIGPTPITAVGVDDLRIGLAGTVMMPGLSDLHTHIGTSPTELLGQQHPRRQQLIEEAARGELLLYLSQGVTSVLNAGDFGEPLPQWRSRVDSGELVGPKIHAARYLRGPPSTPDGGPPGAFATAATARDFIRSSATLGFDMIKIYNYTELAALPVIFDESARLGMAVLGHFPVRQSPIETLDAGMAAVAHGQAFYWIWGVDTRLLGSASAALQRNGTAIIATLGHFEIIAQVWGANPVGLAAYRARPELRFLHPTSRDLNERSITGGRFNPAGAIPGQLEAVNVFVADYLRRFHADGVPLLLGSDSPTVLGVPGFSALEELEVMRDRLGLDESELLRIATASAGDFISATIDGSQRFGRIAVGARADLLLLAADPRADLAHLRTRIGVMAQGRWYREDWLQAQIDALAVRYGDAGRISDTSVDGHAGSGSAPACAHGVLGPPAVDTHEPARAQSEAVR